MRCIDPRDSRMQSKLSYLFRLLKNFEILNQFISRRWKTKHQLRSRDHVWPDRNCGFIKIWVWKRVIFLCFLIHRKQIFTYNGGRIVVRIALKNSRSLQSLFFFQNHSPPRRGIEPRSPAWQAGILTTILPRILRIRISFKILFFQTRGSNLNKRR